MLGATLDSDRLQPSVKNRGLFGGRGRFHSSQPLLDSDPARVGRPDLAGKNAKATAHSLHRHP